MWEEHLDTFCDCMLENLKTQSGHSITEFDQLMYLLKNSSGKISEHLNSSFRFLDELKSIKQRIHEKFSDNKTTNDYLSSEMSRVIDGLDQIFWMVFDERVEQIQEMLLSDPTVGGDGVKP